MHQGLQITQILVYFDLPELFIAKDKVDTRYICLLVENDRANPFYIGTGISKKRLSDFISGGIDLRSIFQFPEINVWFSIQEISGEVAFIEELTFGAENDLPESFLPSKGFYLPKQVIHDAITKEVVDIDNAIVQLALSDNDGNGSIGIDDLGDILKLYQQIVQHSYKKTLKERKIKDRQELLIPQNYSLRAFANSYSSFNIHLYSKSNKDLFGNCLIEYALNKFDEMVSDFDNQEEFIKILRTVKGHTISSYKRLIKKIIDKDISIGYKWFAPNQEFVHHRVISSDYANKVYEILNLSEELTEEIREFIGYVKQADVDKGNWRITNESDGKDYSGESVGGNQLEGVTLETVKYKFICSETIEELTISEAEKVKYYLKSLERVE